MLLILGCAIVLWFLSSCEESFSPSPQFEPRMVVYSILSTDKDTQFVRIYSTYNPSGNDPLTNPEEVPVTDAKVTVTSQDGTRYEFHRIDIERPDKSRYPSNIKAYFAYPFRPEKGKTYTLTASSPTGGTATAGITVPGRGAVEPYNDGVLISPFDSRYIQLDYGAAAKLSPEAKAFLVRIYVDYLSPVGGGYERKRFEVPISRAVISCINDKYKDTFPKPTLRTTPEYAGLGIKSEEKITFRRRAYAGKLLLMRDIEGAGLRFVQAVLYLVQFDTQLWNYYSVANSYPERYSIRVDEPDYTNIKGGLGVFAGVAVDSTVFPLPERIFIPTEVNPCKYVSGE